MGSTSSGSSDLSPGSSSHQGLDAGSPSCHQFHPEWLQYLSQPPPFPCYPTPRNQSEECLFRSGVLDECYQSRFWARALEYFLLDDEQHDPPYGCPMALCPKQDFKDPRNMLRHLKKCEYFPQGKFRCPKCCRIESFKVVSKKKCAWDKVNWAHKLLQKSLKVLQSFSGHRSSCPNFLQGTLQNGSSSIENGSFGSDQITQPNFPMPHTEFDAQYQTEQAPSLWELSDTAIPSDPIPGAPDHQTSPSELPSALFSQSAFSSHFSASPATLMNESPVMGTFPFSSNAPIATSSLPPTSQTSRCGEMTHLTVDTSPSITNVSAPAFEYMLLDEGQTLGPDTSIGSQSMVDLTQGIPMPQFSAQCVPNEPLAAHSNSHLQPSPSISAPSSSSYDLSPSSAPLDQCYYPGCPYTATGKNKPAYMRKHLKTHEKNKIPCDYCDTTCSRQDNLTCHIRRIHPTEYKALSKRRRDSSGSLHSSGQPQRKESRT
ncbi:hypothetical protein GGR51DRAFT_561362 [Nemania sp. FL0031]|nr:hypothetical protein GGR51DRAFT_561362 [Nemania sp. FL0031]